MVAARSRLAPRRALAAAGAALALACCSPAEPPGLRADAAPVPTLVLEERDAATAHGAEAGDRIEVRLLESAPVTAGWRLEGMSGAGLSLVADEHGRDPRCARDVRCLHVFRFA